MSAAELSHEKDILSFTGSSKPFAEQVFGITLITVSVAEWIRLAALLALKPLVSQNVSSILWAWSRIASRCTLGNGLP
jgi:hypothetical protein